MNDSAITVAHVSKSYVMYHHGSIKNVIFHPVAVLREMRKSTYLALKDISFEVYKGECLGIVGKNGAGKSTILGLLAGVLRPTRGKISVKGRVAPLLELGAGFHPDLTGRENIVLNGILMGLTRRRVMNKMDEIIAFSELEEFIDQPIRTYSSGMLARLGFAVVSSLEADILLIDEVLAVGDIEFQKKCMDKMMAFRQAGGTMVLVSHSMSEVERLCDRALLLQDHSIKAYGDTQSVLSRYDPGRLATGIGIDGTRCEGNEGRTR